VAAGRLPEASRRPAAGGREHPVGALGATGPLASLQCPAGAVEAKSSIGVGTTALTTIEKAKRSGGEAREAAGSPFPTPRSQHRAR
jgi:hypothetical protein